MYTGEGDKAMDMAHISRRQFLTHGSAAVASMALLHARLLAHAFPSRPGEEVIPFLEQPQPPSPDVNLLKWAEMHTWITPTAQFFRVAHYNKPVIEEKDWTLEITGLVNRPMTLTLRQLKARPRHEVVCTLECAGNRAEPFAHGLIGTARWAGTPLAPLLQEAEVRAQGIEVVFIGSDTGEEEVRGVKMRQHFARSMSLQDAMHPHNLLCYEMNGAPLPQPHGFPLRLIVPGWYGIASIKWLTRIEVRKTRFMGRFMARDYVTLREEQRNRETVWMETSVGRALLKSVPAKVTRQDGHYRIVGAAWGAPIQRVEVQVDGGPWQPATLERRRHAALAWQPAAHGIPGEYDAGDQDERATCAWQLWSLEWENPAAGEHTIVSRAIDTLGNVQPALDDPPYRQEAHAVGKQRTVSPANSPSLKETWRITHGRLLQRPSRPRTASRERH
jgi:DMSO/TMAO reductase YedYZ molybdopterin-dependent catalytic subunit